MFFFFLQVALAADCRTTVDIPLADTAHVVWSTYNGDAHGSLATPVNQDSSRDLWMEIDGGGGGYCLEFGSLLPFRARFGEAAGLMVTVTDRSGKPKAEYGRLSLDYDRFTVSRLRSGDRVRIEFLVPYEPHVIEWRRREQGGSDPVTVYLFKVDVLAYRVVEERNFVVGEDQND